MGPLADGSHNITASEVDPATGIETMSAGALNSPIDTVAPALPPFSGSAPASPGHSTAPLIKGAVEAGATVTLNTDATCTTVVAGSGTAASTAADAFALCASSTAQG